MMINLLFILGSERYAGEQLREAAEIARSGGYTELFVPTPDGRSRFQGEFRYYPPVTRFKCGTMIVPADILRKIREYHAAAGEIPLLTFCDLIDTWRCEVNRAAARDAGFQSEVLKRGRMIRKAVPKYEYPVK